MSDWQSKIGGVLNTIGTALKPPDATAQFDPASLPTTRQPGYEKAAELAQQKAYQTGQLGIEQQRVDVERQKAGAMISFYKIRDQEALAKLGAKRNETGDIVPMRPEELPAHLQAEQTKAQAQQQHYQDLASHYQDSMELGQMKDALGKETNDIKRQQIKAQIAMTQQRINQRQENINKNWAQFEYNTQGTLSPDAQRHLGRSAANPPPPGVGPMAGTAPPLAPGTTEAPASASTLPAGRVAATVPSPGQRAEQRMGLKSLDKAVAGDQGYQLLQESYNRVQKTGEIKGNDAMMALGAHVGSSIGTIPGIRIGKDLVEAHMKARSLPEDLEAHYNRITSGGGISKDQLQQWWNTAQSARVQRWSGALKEAAGIGGAALDQAGRAIPRGITIPMTGPDGKQYNVKSERAVEMIQKYGAKPL